MDENASRAVFIGVSVLVAIITITLVLSFYRTAKDSASVANRYDISATGTSYLNSILEKEKVTGVELRYLLNYYYGESQVKIHIYQPDFNEGINSDNIELVVNSNDYWSEENQQKLDENIRPNYNYRLSVQETEYDVTIITTFEY